MTPIRGGARGRFLNVVDLVNKLDAVARGGRQGRLADHLCSLDFVILDGLGYSSGQPAALLAALDRWLAEYNARLSALGPRLLFTRGLQAEHLRHLASLAGAC